MPPLYINYNLPHRSIYIHIYIYIYFRIFQRETNFSRRVLKKTKIQQKEEEEEIEKKKNLTLEVILFFLRHCF